MARAARHAQGTAPSIRQPVNLGAEAAVPEGELRLFVWRRARRAHVRAPDRAVPLHAGSSRRGQHPGRTRRPNGDRPRSLSRTGGYCRAIQHSASTQRRQRVSLPA